MLIDVATLEINGGDKAKRSSCRLLCEFILIQDASEKRDMEAIADQVRQWLERVVIGLNLCPFAAVPYRNGQIRIIISQAATEEELLADLRAELVLLDQTPTATLETTLLVVANLLADFETYNDFLAPAEDLLRRGGWEGQYQLATFHPQYCFRGIREDDASNLTNRAPWPILHILREASLDQALADYPDPEAIPEKNIQKMRSLSATERCSYFPWLKGT